MTQQTRTVEEIVLPLAGRMVPCPGVWAPVANVGVGMVFDKETIVHNELCCDGTGKVARFPMLQEQCSFCANPANYAWYYDFDKQEAVKIPHPDCDGRGWLPVTTTDALLEAGKPYGIKLEWVEEGDEGPETWLASAWARHPHRRVFGRSSLLDNETPDPTKALALALEAAVKEANDARPDRAPSA